MGERDNVYRRECLEKGFEKKRGKRGKGKKEKRGKNQRGVLTWKTLRRE